MLCGARPVVAVLAFFAICLWTPFWAAADAPPALKGVALVIGQSDYQHLTPLANPKTDARAMEERLAALGFTTDLALDEGARKLKRSVAGFIEDAEGADVALLYYSGHAIEVGGVNYLLPLDADVSSLDAAEDRLVPVQQVLDELKRKARITILLLDACRTDPFPAGTLVKKTATSKPEPIAAGGLAATKGASVLTVEDQASAETLGEVVGYAAEPGHVALDGATGSNSPYAAALLKHLSANQIYEFSQVMTMVTEEVYLATGTRQRPWTNASLRRFLTFGGKVEEASPDDALIKDARRSLLLTIAATPQETRTFVEALAKEQKLPLDLVYGMLKELEVDTTGGPWQIEKQLKAGAERARQQRAEREALRQSDPEIVAFAKRAEQAESEGALALARDYWAKASARADDLAKTREQNKADVMKRAREAASVYAHHAEAAILTFDHQTAAKEYGKAYQETEWFDLRLAFKYKIQEADALGKHGEDKGDNEALKQALSLYAAALAIAERNNDRIGRAGVQNNLGNILQILGRREGNARYLHKAVIAFDAALAIYSRKSAPRDWAMAENNLGNALGSLSEHEVGVASLRKAVAAYEAALAENTRERSPLDWAATQNNLGIVFRHLGEREDDASSLRKAIVAHEAALSEYARERAPLDWAETQINLGATLQTLGRREGDKEALRKASAAYEAALTEMTRKRMPLRWAAIQNNLGTVLQDLGDRENDTESLRKALAYYEAALAERTRERVPLDWAVTQYNVANTLQYIGRRESDTETLRKAVAAYEAVLGERRRERVPLDWAMTEVNLAYTLQVIGERETGTDSLRKAVAAYEAVLAERIYERASRRWTVIQNRLGDALASLGERETGVDSLRKAVVAYEAALAETEKDTAPFDRITARNSMGYSLTLIGERTGDAAQFVKATAVLRALLAEMEKQRNPRAPYVADSLCRALLGLGAGKRDRPLLLEAKSLCLSALDGEKALRADWAVRETEANLAKIEQALAEID
ncbi:MAG: caspase family protein [Parvibaculaceae bacterium]